MYIGTREIGIFLGGWRGSALGSPIERAKGASLS